MSQKIPIYFSDAAFARLQQLMGEHGKPSPTLNALLENSLEPLQHTVSTSKASSIINAELQKVCPQRTCPLPVTLESIPAGFPAPSVNDIDKVIDLNDILISNPEATFLNVIKTTSMVNAGLEYGDIVVIDRSLEPRHRSIVVALIDQHELTIKRLMVSAQMSRAELEEEFGEDGQDIPERWLKAESPEYDNICLKPGQTFSVLAVVTWNLKKMLA
jgi:DNA polymerase V